MSQVEETQEQDGVNPCPWLCRCRRHLPVQVIPRVRVMQGFGSDWEVTCQQKPPTRQVVSLELLLLGESALPQ